MAAAPASATEHPLLTTIIKSKVTQHTFQLEQALTPKEQQTGLMHRISLPADGGMVFHYNTPRAVYMWMHDTLIPLDMLFVSGQGRIVHIIRNAQPGDETPRGTPVFVSDVIELPGGTADRLGIEPGDHVTFKKDQP